MAEHCFSGPENTAESRRLRDILRGILNDIGGERAPLSQGQLQLSRRAAALSLSCERIEARLCRVPEALEERIKELAGGLSPHQILAECGRLLHAVARHRGGSKDVAAIAALPDEKLAVVTDLLKAAADISAKAITVGGDHGADLALLGELSDRLGRCFTRLGLARQPREVNPLAYQRTQQQEVFSPLRQTLSEEVIDVPSEAAE